MAHAAGHVFHTRHDFTPELGWSAFQLLAGATDGLSRERFEALARATGAAVARRADAGKILAGLGDVGLAEAGGGCYRLTEAGRALARGAGRFEPGFRAAVHCLYAWTWCRGRPEGASPSWSYRQVCRCLLEAPGGLGVDDLVLQIVRAAERFGAERVSFSRSSVAGVTAWLAAQSPPLALVAGGRVRRAAGAGPSDLAVRLHLAALCGPGGVTRLDEGALSLLAEALLLAPEVLQEALGRFTEESSEFVLGGGRAREVRFRGSTDPFVTWLAVPTPDGE